MALLMKEKFGKCQASLEAGGEAFVCSFECTFCGSCASSMDHVCANCSGELVRRPRRKTRRKNG